jgi:hypothetical protein
VFPPNRFQVHRSEPRHSAIYVSPWTPPRSATIKCRTVVTHWMNFAIIRWGVLLPTMLFSFAWSFTIARRNRASHFTFARSTLQCSGASQQSFLVPACGELLCFRHQLLRLLNGFRFLRIRACRDLSSFTCVWHILIVSHFSMQDVQFCIDPPPSPAVAW